ncbi:unnamed protein product [Rotaria sp. Silwood1]|nr:unnamed protein product [Rotaria sp. Silwood1]
MNSILTRILSYGISKDKLIMSIPTYGLSFILEDNNKYNINDRLLGQGFPGRITHKKGILAAYEICDLIKQENYRKFFDNNTLLFMAHKLNKLIIYDDTERFILNNNIIRNGTIEYKSNIIINNNIAGVLVHYIDMDDYIGLSCNRGQYPITSLVSQIFSLNKSSLQTTTIKNSTQFNNLCSGISQNQLIEDKSDCRYYYLCQLNNSKPISHLQCPQYMTFSTKEKICTYQHSNCSSNGKFNSIIKPIEKSEEFLSRQSNKVFECEKANGIFSDLSDCRQYILCSNKIPFLIKCPLKTKFNSLLNRCNWWSNICP